MPSSVNAAGEPLHPLIIGAGPAGLTAAYQFAKAGHSPLLVEASEKIGGISRTETLGAYRYDLGGHRFFSKSTEIENLWDELSDEPLLVRPRLSRIFYDGDFYDYPLRVGNALANMGARRAAEVCASYLAARIHPDKNDESFEAWVSNRFGRRLYKMFFESYTEKVWGRPCSDISAEWAAQRIRNLSLGTALRSAVGLGRKGDVTTLIDRFRYPRFGPGQLWESSARRSIGLGASIRLGERVVAFDVEGDSTSPIVTGVTVQRSDGSEAVYSADWVASSMPLRDLVAALPIAPPEVRRIAGSLGYRGFIVVAVVLDEPSLFPDNWVYIHSGSVRLARVQNFGNWSPDLVPDQGTSCLGLEFFADPGDDLWTRADHDLISMAESEVRKVGLVRKGHLLSAGVTRVPDAYPVYQRGHAALFGPLQAWLSRLPNLVCVGRAGQHRYNNMDHSMMTALLAVKNALGDRKFDVWSVNAEADYHEEADARS